MDDQWLPLALAAAGIVGGLALLWRGLRAHGTGTRIADVSTSRIATLAAGEVRVSGVVEPAGVTIVSPLQSAPCVWYRASVSAGDSGGVVGTPDWSDERGVGFRVVDGSGSIRVFPRGAELDVPERFSASTDLLGDEPIGLRPNPDVWTGPFGGGRRTYREARLEPGDVVTIVGAAVPFGQLADPVVADSVLSGGVGSDDPEVAADIAEARAAGMLVAADDAWGNAAIPGFGIGRPVSEPELDPGVLNTELASGEEAATFERSFDLEPDELVLASGPDGRLLIGAGSPGDIGSRHRYRSTVGLLGAVLAIGSALAAAWLLAQPVAP